MSKLNHTPHPWRPGENAGAVVCDEQHEGNHIMGTAGPAPSDLEFYGGYLLAESITRKADQELMALATTAPHDCDQPDCPGRALGEALRVLMREHIGDFIYNIRDRELEGWDGPRVKAWGAACATIKKTAEAMDAKKKEKAE